MIKFGDRLRLFRSSKTAASTVILLFLFIFLVSISLAIPVHRWGDASTYYMQTQSIATDFDIQYEQKDLRRALENKFDDLPAGLMLIKDKEGNYFYGKEFAYALFATPFFKVLGNNGILLFNAIMFFLMIYMGYLFLKRQNSDRFAMIFSICYFFASAAFVYIFWIHTEIYSMFLIMLGLFLWFKSMSFDSGKSVNSVKGNKSELTTSQTPNNWLFISAAVFGLATFTKIPNAILFLPLLGWELYNKRFKNLILCVSFFVIPLIILFGYFFLTTGTLTPYSGDRLGYRYKFPLMEGYCPNNEIGHSANMVSSNFFSRIATLNMTILLYDMFYYLFGRFTGFTWYYMPAIIALYLMFKGKIENYNSRIKSIFNLENVDIKRVLLLAAIILNALFYIVNGINSSFNYFGGAHAIGNRYFYIFPAFLFLIDKIKFDKKLVAFFMIAILFTAPINIDPVGNSSKPCMHTVKLPYSALPVEYTQLNALPFWGCSHKIGDISYYYLDDDVKWRSNGFLIEKSSDMLIKSKSKISDYGILLSSSSDNNLICLSIGDVTKSLTLNRKEVKLLTFSNLSPVYDENYFVYKIHISSDDEIWFTSVNLGTLYYIDNWHGLEHWRNIPTRWISNNACIVVGPIEDKDSKVSFNVLSYRKPRNLQVYLNDEIIHEQTISTSFVEVEIPVKLKQGENVLRFYTPDGCQRPCDIPALNTKDARCLSLAFQNITIT